MYLNVLKRNMNSFTQHLAIYRSGNKQKFIYDLDTDTTEYTYHESLKYRGNYSICIQEFMLAVNLYKKIIKYNLQGTDVGTCKNTLKLIYITYWLESYRIKQQFYLEKWGAGMDFGKNTDSFCKILSGFCDGFIFHDYEYYLRLSRSNDIYDRLIFKKNDFVPQGLLKNLSFKYKSNDYSNDVFLNDIIDINGKFLERKPFIKKYKKKFKELGMDLKTYGFSSQLESYLYKNSIYYNTDEEEEYEFVDDEEEEILLTVS